MAVIIGSAAKKTYKSCLLQSDHETAVQLASAFTNNNLSLQEIIDLFQSGRLMLLGVNSKHRRSMQQSPGRGGGMNIILMSPEGAVLFNSQQPNQIAILIMKRFLQEIMFLQY